MKLKSHNEDRVKCYEPYTPKETVTKITVLKDGRLVEITEKDESQGLSYEDFSVSSLLKAGAVDLLKNRVKLSGSVMDVADDVALVDSRLDGIDEILENKTKNE